MGIVYCGPYADAINEGERYEHEGYADRKMPDGRFSNGVWSTEFPWKGPGAHVAFVAACACGRRSTVEHPPTVSGQEAAEDEWDREHLRPLIDAVARRHTVPAAVLLSFVKEIRSAMETTTDVDGDRTALTQRSCGIADVANWLEELLDDQASQGGDGV